MYDDMNLWYCMIMNYLCNRVSGELKSNVSVLYDRIDIWDGVTECDRLCIEDVCFIIIDICIK